MTRCRPVMESKIEKISWFVLKLGLIVIFILKLRIATKNKVSFYWFIVNTQLKMIFFEAELQKLLTNHKMFRQENFCHCPST